MQPHISFIQCNSKVFPVTSAEAVYSNYADSFILGGNHGGIGHFGSRIGKF